MRIDALVSCLLALRVLRPDQSYLSMSLGRDWTLDDLADLGGRAATLDQLAASGRVALGGIAPIWADVAAIARALDRAPATRGQVFDPKVVAGLVEIPPAPALSVLRRGSTELGADHAIPTRVASW